jgi:hypothetical protein
MPDENVGEVDLRTIVFVIFYSRHFGSLFLSTRRYYFGNSSVFGNIGT